MTAITTPRLKESTDSLLRFAMRLDATISGLVGVAGLFLANWLAEISGTTAAFEYATSASFVVFSIAVLVLASRPAIRVSGLVLAVGNLLFSVATVVLVLADVFPLTPLGVALVLGTGVYTLVMAELQYQGLRRLKR